MTKNYTLHDLPQEDRPRERLQTVGLENLSLQELLALIIERGKKNQNVLQIAQNLLSRFGNLRNIKEASLTELQEIRGVGLATACKLKAALKLGEKLQQDNQKFGTKIEKPEDVFRILHKQLANKKKEHFRLLCLDSRNRIITIEKISVGTLNAALAHPREIFRAAIRNSSASVILVHNHPSGDPQPSAKDKELTERLRKAGKIIGIKVADHIIITRQSFTSFLESTI